jgi:hypothetical protein
MMSNFTLRELQEIKTALLLSKTKTMDYPFVDEETKEIMSVIDSALTKVTAELNSPPHP